MQNHRIVLYFYLYQKWPKKDKSSWDWIIDVQVSQMHKWVHLAEALLTLMEIKSEHIVHCSLLHSHSPWSGVVCWEMLAAGIQGDVTLMCITYLNIAAYTLLHGNSIPLSQCSQGNALCYAPKLVKELFEEHDKQFKMLTPNYPTYQKLTKLLHFCILWVS